MLCKTVTFTNTESRCLQYNARKTLASNLAPNKSIGLLTKLKNYSIYERVAELEVEGIFNAVFALEAIVPRACTYITGGLELEIWEQIYCLSTSGATAHALFIANEIPSSNAVSQRSLFPVPLDKGNEGSGNEIDSDVSYIMKAFCDTLSCLFPFCIHITCHSHIVNLVASDFKKGFKEMTKFVKSFCNLFFIPSGRKSRFLNFLQKALYPGESVTMPPNPTTKSWSAWFNSVLYHVKFCFLFEDFVQEELSPGRNVASSSLLRLEEIFQDESFMKLRAQFAFLEVKAPTLMVYLNYFQERVPHITQAHEKMESLLLYLHTNTNVEEEDLKFCFEGDFNCKEKKELMCLFNSAFT